MNSHSPLHRVGQLILRCRARMVALQGGTVKSSEAEPGDGQRLSPADRLRRRFVKLLAAAFAVTKAADLLAAIDAETAGPPVPTPPPPTSSGSPFLAFSDLQSGPKSGNTDTSRGAPLGVDGAIVSVWGNFLGAEQGTSKLTINGADCRIYYWGPAVPPWSPANLHPRQGMQLIIAQVSHAAVDGIGQIVATVNGVASNALPFTVRPGRILYWMTSGSDAGDGTWQKAFKSLTSSIVNARANKPGDIIYLGDGVNCTNPNLAIALTLSTTGTADMPMSLVTYPGARSEIGNEKVASIVFYNGDRNPPVTHWKVSKVTLRGKTQAIGLGAGCDLIGSDVVSGTVYESNEGVIGGNSRGMRVLGNEIHHCGTGKTNLASLMHCIYFSATRESATPVPDVMEGYEIAWNHFHDLIVNRAINVYNQRSTGHSAHIGNGKIHHNAFVDCCGAGIGLLACTVGNNWVYSNLLIRCGKENPFAGDRYQIYSGMQFLSGYLLVGNARDTSRKREIVNHVWNNTLVDCGVVFNDNRKNNSGSFLMPTYKAFNFDFHNNVMMQSNGAPYIAPGVVPTNAELGSLSHNAWGGAGPLPAFELNGVSITDWEPKAGSPIIGSGLPTPFPMRDFTGRPIVRDMGAFQSARHRDRRVKGRPG